MSDALHCPFCEAPIYFSEPYILSDKPAYDSCCNNPDCKVKPRMFEQRDLEAMREVWKRAQPRFIY